MMTPRKRQSRVYWRRQGGARRAYGDFRDYSDVGGTREPLIPLGERFATSDPDLALRLALRRLEELEAARKRRALTGKADVITLAEFARDYLIAKKQTGNVTVDWLKACQKFLERAVAFLGADRPLDAIRVSDVRAWSSHLLHNADSVRGKPFSADSVRRHLFTLSNLYRLAQEAEHVPPGFNPVASFSDKPPKPQRTAAWLEAHDVALLLESARTVPTPTTPFAAGFDAGFVWPLLATLALTGGRRGEVLGLELDDVSLDRQTVTFRANRWRDRLKTEASWRVVPLWPQLEAILRVYLFGPRMLRGGSLLFPSFVAGREQPLREIRPMVDRVAVRAGWKPREINARMFRHAYCAARLQTLDRGAPVSVYTVSREMGHGSTEMVEKVYSHLGTVRHRSDVVEFRIDQHLDALKDRLGWTSFVTGNDTAGQEPIEKGEAPPSVTFDEASLYDQSGRRDLNPGPLAPEASALPGCATPRSDSPASRIHCTCTARARRDSNPQPSDP